MEFLIENKENVMDDYLFHLKFTASRTGLKMLCLVTLISAIHCFTEMISTNCGLTGGLSDEVETSWLLSPFSSLSQLCQPGRKKQFITN